LNYGPGMLNYGPGMLNYGPGMLNYGPGILNYGPGMLQSIGSHFAIEYKEINCFHICISLLFEHVYPKQ